MKKLILIAAFAMAMVGCAQKSSEEPFKAFNIDFNWGEGGPNAFPAPGTWADADPEEHIRWYEALGCNVVHSFAVSCNGYAWYKNGIVAEQPGLKHDFLTETVRMGHERGMKVFGYFCVGANTKWGLEHPDQSYGIPSDPHIPFTNEYLDYLCASIKDALLKTNMDGIMLDWIWNPGSTMEPYPPLRWLECEQQMYLELMGATFPGADKITSDQVLDFRRRAIARCWQRIYETAKQTKPDCLIWLSCCQTTSQDVVDSEMFRQVDILMNEGGDMAGVDHVRKMIGPQTKLVTCLANWNGQDPAVIIPAAIKAGIGVYGFTKPTKGSLLDPVESYLEQRMDTLKGDAKNIAGIARIFNGFDLDYVKQK